MHLRERPQHTTTTGFLSSMTATGQANHNRVQPFQRNLSGTGMVSDLGFGVTRLCSGWLVIPLQNWDDLAWRFRWRLAFSKHRGLDSTEDGSLNWYLFGVCFGKRERKSNETWTNMHLTFNDSMLYSSPKPTSRILP